MGEGTEKITNFSIWDSVVNDRIVQFEDLDKKYRSRGKQIEIMLETNEKLKDDMDDIFAKYDFMKRELEAKDVQIQKLKKEKEELKQSIINMENSSSWKITRPLRMVFDRIKNRSKGAINGNI